MAMRLSGHGGLARGGAILGAAIACAAVAPAASATTDVLGKVGGLKYVRASDTVAAASMSPTARTVRARCGAREWETTGGGVALEGTARTSYLSQSSDFVNSWYGTGWHLSQAARKLSTYGICSKSTAITHDTHVNSFPSAPPTSVASGVNLCAQGHVLGGGTLATTGPAKRFINTTNPYDSASDADDIPDDGWQVYMAVLDGSGSILVYNICRKAAPVYRSVQGSVDDNHSLTVSARCPSGHVAGGGVYETGNAQAGHVVATRPIDTGDADKIPDDGWSGKVYNETGITQTVTATAICI
jgi:hypothetical protein